MKMRCELQCKELKEENAISHQVLNLALNLQSPYKGGRDRKDKSQKDVSCSSTLQASDRAFSSTRRGDFAAAVLKGGFWFQMKKVC